MGAFSACRLRAFAVRERNPGELQHLSQELDVH